MSILRVVVIVLFFLVIVLSVSYGYFIWSLEANKESIREFSVSDAMLNKDIDGDLVDTKKRDQEAIVVEQSDEFFVPISTFEDRIIHKHFSDFISPATSPTQPERFTGYHTGVDAEIADDEIEDIINVYSLSDGIVRRVGTASGYGGIVVIEFLYKTEAYTALYGHIQRSSVSLKEGDSIRAGEKIGVLGAHLTSETDGERKHLHFGIHKGIDIVLSEYALHAEQLDAWIDPLVVLEGAREQKE